MLRLQSEIVAFVTKVVNAKINIGPSTTNFVNLKIVFVSATTFVFKVTKFVVVTFATFIVKATKNIHF